MTVQEMFGRICPRYDLLNHVLSLGLDFYWRRRAVRELGVGAGDPVIDLCCGTGDLAAELWRCVRPGEVVGVDFSDRMIDRARRKYPQLTYVQGDVLRVELPPGRFAAATIAFGPRNIQDLEGLWREMARLVRPGGKILSLELTRPPGWLGWLHGLYLRHVLPKVGSWLSGDQEAYAYLSRTVQGFVAPQELAESMRRAGLEQIRIVPLTGGIVTLHLARTPLA
ncbi:MAG: ubiquinone/menaquinone biosynthesis methyltransferase [Armatimonadetes bacterium]|nr:ubiquinone/menaquinone biosynthesis methyltransferase [Armatimonadota bacterium]